MKRRLVAVAWVASLACAAPAGPRVRFATATTQELEAVAGAEAVWYELREGDEFPLTFLLGGVVTGGAEAIRLRATRSFWVVVRRSAPARLSFDGTTLHDATLGEALLRLGPGADGRPEALLLLVVGLPGEREGALRELAPAAE
ncbi:MAG: hypothetical protein AAF447_27875 [Myxococcota bacterium]